mgnify:CR=1 FL=1
MAQRYIFLVYSSSHTKWLIVWPSSKVVTATALGPAIPPLLVGSNPTLVNVFAPRRQGCGYPCLLFGA